ncbi:hypothetical protein FNL56_07195 [Tardiphaga sp. vice304]|uniref:hypothetical protein n=1 Tax=Tardiphaga sp. vice304 TaxID=2592817 RepID=UPI001162F2C8|nr:hypothetical protein [Tardiphaga sp. vice304]QDM25923.1 hypothetical protein FNL56_07195 [Tardiphaga sp. vice304]
MCASYFYNRKKLNNGSDCLYLFGGGAPTETFFATHGELSAQQAKLLKQHRKIELSDWYFNRAIYNVMVAIDNELARSEAVRTKEYWLGSARKRIATWKKLTGGVSTFETRGLVRFLDAEDIALMLGLCDASDRKWEEIYKGLLKWTRANQSAMDRFSRADDKASRLTAIADATAKKVATAPMIEFLRKNARLL